LPDLIGQSRQKELDYPVKSDADLREESLRPDNDKYWNRGRYEYEKEEVTVWEKKLSFMARLADLLLKRPGRPMEKKLNISMSK
jgi:hypothetical protein